MPRSRSADVFDDALAGALAADIDDKLDRDLGRKADLIRKRGAAVQVALLEDPSPRKAARCGRRAGKTTAALLVLADFLSRHPAAIGWYIATTLKNARKLLWAPLKRLNIDL